MSGPSQAPPGRVEGSSASRLGLRRPDRWGPVLVRAGLTTALLGGLLLWLPVDELAGAAARVGLAGWLGLVAGFVAGHAVGAVKWALLLGAAGLATPPATVGRAYAAGLFANLWLPSIVGGDVVRAALLAPRGGLARLATAGVVDRGIDTAVLVGLAAVGLALVPAGRGDVAVRILQVAAAGLALGLAAAPLALRLVPPERLPAPLQRPARRLREAVGALARRPGRLALATGLSVVVQGSFVLLNYALARAVGVEIPVAAWFGVWPLAKLAGLVPVSLGGLGVREVAHVALLAPFGVPPTLAVAQSLVWQTVLMAAGAACGAAVLATGRPLPAAEQEGDAAHRDA